MPNDPYAPNWQEIDASTLPNAFYAHSDAASDFNNNLRKLEFWRSVLVGLGTLAGALALFALFVAAVYELGRW